MALGLILFGICYGGYFGLSVVASNSSVNTDAPIATARLTTLVDKVVEQGTLESQSTVTGNCEIDDSENKIIYLAPEGMQVSKDEIVVKFDDSEIREEISEREARVNESKAEVATARQELKVQEDENVIAIRKAEQDLKFAELDLKKYLEGDYKVSKSEKEQAISEAQTEVDKANRDMEITRTQVKRGFREYQQLEESRQVVKSANLRLINARQKLETLEKFEHVKSEAEFKGKAVEAKYALSIAKTTAAAKLAKAKDRLKNEEAGLKIQENRLKEQQKDLERHIMKAPQDGTFTYARDDWRGNGEKLHEGSVIYRNQPVFVLPDMKRMQVKVGIHETLVSKVAPGQSAVIKVDAFAGLTLRGEVKSVSQMSASTRWERSNNYHVIVTIEPFSSDIRLKPGMNAEVEILVGRYEDRLAVPIQSVTSFGEQKFVFARNEAGDFEAREVETEESTISFVAIKSGIEDGAVVALDAYQRGLAEFDTNDTEKMIEMELDEMDESSTKEEKAADSKIGMTSQESSEEAGAKVQSADESSNTDAKNSEATAEELPEQESSTEQAGTPEVKGTGAASANEKESTPSKASMSAEEKLEETDASDELEQPRTSEELKLGVPLGFSVTHGVALNV